MSPLKEIIHPSLKVENKLIESNTPPLHTGGRVLFFPIRIPLKVKVMLK